jgi:hypothetical protein
MNNLLKYKDQIFEIKRKVESKDPSLFSYSSIKNNTIDENTISIVMTSSNRSKQTYFTLKSFLNSEFKNLQIIIVDDSDIDPISIDIIKEQNYPYTIELIKINRENKNWHNPLVNYNLGFQFIQGGKVIIQNAEVCHVGCVIDAINTRMQNNSYYVFDVKASLEFESNEVIYNKGVSSVDIYKENIYKGWYQSSHENNRGFHFLTAMNREVFDKIKNFSYDCTMGCSWDDDDFLLKIRSKHVTILNIYHETYHIGGIHLFHAIAGHTWDKNIELNDKLVHIKQKIFKVENTYIDVTENVNDFEYKYNVLLVRLANEWFSHW